MNEPIAPLQLAGIILLIVLVLAGFIALGVWNFNRSFRKHLAELRRESEDKSKSIS